MVLKIKIKSTYNIITWKNLLHFVRETEFMHKNLISKFLYNSTDLEYVQNDLFRKEEEN